MDEGVDKIDDLEVLGSLLGDIERARLEQMREECIMRKRALERIKTE